MSYQTVDVNSRDTYNSLVSHPLQAFEWGEFREKTGVKVIRRANKTSAYQMTVHKLSGFPFRIGYLPKGDLPSKELLTDLRDTGKNENLSFIQLEPDVVSSTFTPKFGGFKVKESFHPLFTKYTFVLDLSPNEEELLKNMHQKTRYNIRLSQKHGVEVKKDNSDKAFEEYLKLTEETTKRQKFYAHGSDYHKKMWETLKGDKFDPNRLQAHLLTATYKNKKLVTWILFTFKDRIFYPYGASSSENREVMASSLMMWEAIRFGKNLGLKKFDMWGALGPDADKNDPWYGFHRFKEGFGGELVEFVGSYDLVLSPFNYRLLTVGDKARWAYLRLRR